MVSRPPFTMRISSAFAKTPFGASSFSATISRSCLIPWTGPYCNASTPRVSRLSTSDAISRISSTGSASDAGAPPPKEMVSGSFIAPKSPLIMAAEPAIYSIRFANAGMFYLQLSSVLSNFSRKASNSALSPVNLYLCSGAGNVPALTSAM